MNKAPKVALISEELLSELIDLLPREVQARVMCVRCGDGKLVTALYTEGCECCEGAR